MNALFGFKNGPLARIISVMFECRVPIGSHSAWRRGRSSGSRSRWGLVCGYFDQRNEGDAGAGMVESPFGWSSWGLTLPSSAQDILHAGVDVRDGTVLDDFGALILGAQMLLDHFPGKGRKKCFQAA